MVYSWPLGSLANSNEHLSFREQRDCSYMQTESESKYAELEGIKWPGNLVVSIPRHSSYFWGLLTRILLFESC